ncbi:MAG TPA: hypothetical protein DDW76_14735 [Cyanobacteria bacterium UBA11369]|nr:hypothetical protein [Cyanobacteria bacterium UBA11371]HBE17593.1 hypothetical protein [Cyanobacteria bacterium UBA11367]HBE36081.1 hypothetical protein [Cyanobacteria bacterium UBA11368]HBE50013.1 hypothetical protein [Cyanobacteria bacterium UBA11369]
MVKILGPNDRSPRPDRHHDYMDYRGVAEEREVKDLYNGVVSLGRYLHPHGKQGRELFMPVEILKRHSAVIGRTGAGKTEGIIIPWVIGLLKSGYSVVTVDVVGNLVNRLSNEAKKLGCRVWYWDSGNPTYSDSWNWLNEISLSDDNDVEEAIYSILGRPNPNDPQRFFYERNVRWLRALIPIVKKVYTYNAKPSNLQRIVIDQNALRNLFRQYPQIQKYDINLGDLFAFSSNEHSRAVSELLNPLDVFTKDSVIHISERNDFLLSDIDTRPTLLILGYTPKNHQSAQLTSLILNQLFNHVSRRSKGKVGKRLPLYFVIDEASSLQDKIAYEEVLATARNADVGICLAVQDITQFGDERKATEVLSNCNTIIATKGVTDKVADYLSRQMGLRREQQIRVTQQRTLADDFRDIDRGNSFFGVVLGSMFSPPTAVDTVEVPVLGSREIMHPPVGHYPAVVLSSPVTNKPFIVDLDTAVRNI